MNDEPAWRTLLADYLQREAQPVAKFGHQPRLYALTQRIGAGRMYDDDVLYASAYLHDLGVFIGHRPEDPAVLQRWDHVAYAIEKTPSILESVGFPSAKMAAVIECIRNHQAQDTPQTIESTILRDADILEQLGAIGILRTVCKVGHDTRFATFSDAEASLRRALHKLPALLTLPVSRALAEERIRIHREFLDAIATEADGRLL